MKWQLATFEPLEQLLAELESGEHGLLFSSGMAAISAVVDQLALGAHLVLPSHAYMGFSTLAQQMADKGLLTLHRADISDTEQVLSTVDEAAAAGAEGRHGDDAVDRVADQPDARGGRSARAVSAPQRSSGG